MPSWEVHNKIAEMLGFDRVSSETVNSLIDDPDYIHDLGRRMPKLGLKMKYFDPESFLRISTSLTLRLSKLGRYPDLFYLHHAVDLLSLRMASAILIGCDVKDRKDCVIEGIERDLNYLHYKIQRAVRNVPSAVIPAYRREELVEKLRSNYERIVGMEEFVEWVKREIVDRRIGEDSEELAQVVKALYGRLCRAKEKWTSEWISTAPPKLSPSYYAGLVSRVAADEKARYLLGRFFQGVNKLAARRSRLFDYVLIYSPYSLSIISEELLSSNKGLGKDIRNAIAEGCESDRIRGIVSRNWIISELNEMPSTVVDTYVGLILKAAPIMKACLDHP